MTAWETAWQWAINGALDNVCREIQGLPRIEYPMPPPIKLYEYRCLEDHVRTGQDIHGTIVFKKGDVINSNHATLEDLNWTLEAKYFEKVIKSNEEQK